MEKAAATYVFGPVASRRLGRSLGIDLVPGKTCSFDCIYCQLGRTTLKTQSGFRFRALGPMLDQLRAKLAAGPRPDHVTLGGSGEPTLCENLADVIGAIRGATDVPLAVLTNGSLLWRPEVRRACALADVVIPSLDAGSEAVFERINRPSEGLTLARVVEGMATFRAEYRGGIWLEIFLVEGVNTARDELERMRILADRIRPDRIHLNTAVRPTAEPDARAVSADELRQAALLFGPRAEVIADFPAAPSASERPASESELLDLIRRHPCSAADAAAGLGAPLDAVRATLEALAEQGRIVRVRREGGVHYRAES